MNSLELISSQFHFLRPLWLWVIIPVAILLVLLWQQKRNAQQWQQMIAPELLKHLLDGQTTRIQPWQLLGLLFAWSVACIALAGPSWEKRPAAVEQNQQALVILLDLSPSMLSEDIKPSRLNRARLKITDILRARKDGQTALIAYAGEAHVVTPLTDDVETINNIVPALHPNVMPLQGSNTEAAVTRAIQLLQDSGLQQGDLLLITDEVTSDAQYALRQEFKHASQFRLSILGVGGTTPAPIPTGKGGFIRDKQRNIVTTQLNVSELKALAQATLGRYATIANSNKDIDYLMNLPEPKKEETTRVEREFDNWYDQGHWLVFLLLPIVLYCFRRGLLVVLICIPLSGLVPQKSYALTWDDLWKNNNQQAHEKFEQENHSAAAEQFTDNNWQASANYRAGNYADAAQQFAQADTAEAHYNRGNALAKSGQLEEAVKAYDEALKLAPELSDAEKNRELVKQAIKQQQQQQQGDNKDNNNQDQKDQDKEKQDQEKNNEQKQDQQSQDKNQQNNDNQQQSDQEQGSQQNSDNQNSDLNKDQQQSEEQKSEQKKAEQQKSKDQKEQEEQAQQEAEEDAAQEAKEDAEKAEEAAMQAGEPKDDGLTDEERQAMEQWLRRVPDDPGGLLRNKFNHQYRKNRQDMHNGDFQPPENDAGERW